MLKHHYTRAVLAAGVVLIVVLGWSWWPQAEPVSPPGAPPTQVQAEPPSPSMPREDGPPAESPPPPTGSEPITVEGHFIGESSWAPVQTTATLLSQDGTRRAVTSGADGSFSTRLEPGAWRVESADGDFVAATDKPELLVPVSGAVLGVRLRFARLEWIEGLVTDNEQVPLADTRINDAISDQSGRFRVRAIREPSRLTVSHRCCKPGHSWSEKAGQLVLRLRRWSTPPLGQVRGVLVNAQGRPCRGFVGLVEAPIAGSILFTTAKDGTFTLPVFGADSRAYALSSGERVESEPLRVGQPLRLVLPCGEKADDALLSGRVVDASGTPWTSCSIGAGLHPQGVTNSDGSFAVRVARQVGTWHVFCLGTTGSTEVRADLSQGDVSVGDVVLPRAAVSLSGSISDRSSRAPIAHASIMVFLGLGMSRAAMSDESGDFTVNVPALPVRVLITANGYVPLELKIEASPLTIELTRVDATDGGVRQEYEGVGLGLTRRSEDGGDGLRVTLVAGGGPAEEAGVRVSDELLAVDDVPVTDFARPRDLHERIKGPAGTWVKLSLRREGRVFDVRVQRRRIER